MSESFFKGKIAVVTGAGGTLGSAVAVDLARRGAKTALLGRTLEKLERVAARIREAGGTALAVAVDVTDAASVEAARQVIHQEWGPCAFLVNSAGGNQTEAVTTSTEFDPEEIAAAKPEGIRGFFNLDPGRMLEVIKLNTIGTLVPCQVFGRDMAEQGGGAVVNFASMNTYRPLSRNLAYGVAKAGVANLTQWLAAYLAPAGIRVNAVAPGFFLNERSRKILLDDEGGPTARGRNVVAHTPQRRFGEAGELVGAVCWLLNDEEAGFVTGITVPVDGGFLASSGV